MSSILTNMSAMTAVQNLAATQKSLADVQNEISTGLKVSSAKDNAAYYSIATNMRTNIGNLSAVSDSLNLGSSVVATATSATTNLTTVLQSISKALVSASQPGTDLNSVNTQIAALQAQLGNTVASSSFNGVNLLDGSTAADPQVKFVSGVTGSGANTTVNTLTIDTTKTNFLGASVTSPSAALLAKAQTASNLVAAQTASTTASTNLTAGIAANTVAVTSLTSAINSATAAQLQNANSTQFQNLFGAGASIDTSSGIVSNIAAGSLAANLVGTDGSVTVGKALASSPTTTINYSVGNSATGTLGNLYGASATDASTAGTSTSLYGVNAAATTALASATAADTAATGSLSASDLLTSKGAFFAIGQISLTSGNGTANSATSASQIATFIKQVGAAISAVTTASETLGAASSNIDLQSTYTSSLSTSLTSGVGSLVDADMNEASTRLNALQTQQQLGVQALSVANQNSQLILKLFQ